MISVIVPVYNAATTVGDCVRSISAGAVVDYEIILVDDGSKDNSLSECRRLQKENSRIRVYPKPNGGVSSARNLGLDIAQGDIICFVDSDDQVEKGYLNEISTKIGDSDILFFGYERINNGKCDEECVPSPLNVSNEEQIQQEIVSLFNCHGKNLFGFTWSKAFRKSIIDKYQIRFDPRLEIKEDEIFTLEYCNHLESLSTLPKPLYKYTYSNTSLSHRENPNVARDLLAEYYERFSMQFSAPSLKLQLQELSFSYFLGDVKKLLKQGELRKADIVIKEKIIPMHLSGIGREAARWMRLVNMAPQKWMKSILLKLFLRK